MRKRLAAFLLALLAIVLIVPSSSYAETNSAAAKTRDAGTKQQAKKPTPKKPKPKPKPDTRKGCGIYLIGAC
jgi:hypothetical protein